MSGEGLAGDDSIYLWRKREGTTASTANRRANFTCMYSIYVVIAIVICALFSC